MSLTRAEIVSRGHPIWAEVDLSAIRHNIRALSERAPGAEVMGVVKGYAYGHGNPESALAMLEAGRAGSASPASQRAFTCATQASRRLSTSSPSRPTKRPRR